MALPSIFRTFNCRTNVMKQIGSNFIPKWQLFHSNNLKNVTKIPLLEVKAVSVCPRRGGSQGCVKFGRSVISNYNSGYQCMSNRSWFCDRSSCVSNQTTFFSQPCCSLHYSQRHLQTDKENKPELKTENIMTIPNLLTVSRLALSPVLGYLILQQSYPTACALFVFTGITDLLDGWIARRWPSQASSFGTFCDPLADKFLATIVYVSLSCVHLIPVPLTALVVCRDVGLIAAAFYIRYLAMVPPFTWATYFNVTLPAAEIKPPFISKLNTAVQLSCVAFSLAAPVFNFIDHPALHALWFLTASTTVASGVTYMFKKDTYKITSRVKPKS